MGKQDFSFLKNSQTSSSTKSSILEPTGIIPYPPGQDTYLQKNKSINLSYRILLWHLRTLVRAIFKLWHEKKTASNPTKEVQSAYTRSFNYHLFYCSFFHCSRLVAAVIWNVYQNDAVIKRRFRSKRILILLVSRPQRNHAKFSHRCFCCCILVESRCFRSGPHDGTLENRFAFVCSPDGLG